MGERSTFQPSLADSIWPDQHVEKYQVKRLQLLDYGRFFAAVSVVAFHYLFNGIRTGKISSLDHIPSVVSYAKYGYLGVEFFFMISGYVIFFSAKTRTASEFAVSRAVRLYPAFWAAVVLTSVFAVFWGGPQMHVQFLQVIANLTMIPAELGFKAVDGVYWTLSLELFFYFMILCLLLAGFQRNLELLLLLWPVLMLVTLATGMDGVPFLGGYFSYFAAGSVFAIQKNNLTKWSVFSLMVSAFLCVSNSVENASAFSISRGVPYSSFVVSLIISMQFSFFLLLNSSFGSNMKLLGSRTLGALTYPVYLIHANLGYMFLSHFATQENAATYYALTFSLILGIAYAINRLIENRYAQFWRSLFERTLGVSVNAIDTFIRASAARCRRSA